MSEIKKSAPTFTMAELETTTPPNLGYEHLAFVSASTTPYYEEAKLLVRNLFEGYIMGVHVNFKDKEILQQMSSEVAMAKIERKPLPSMEDLVASSQVVTEAMIEDIAYMIQKKWLGGEWSLAKCVLVSHAASSLICNMNQPYKEDCDTTFIASAE